MYDIVSLLLLSTSLDPHNKIWLWLVILDTLIKNIGLSLCLLDNQSYTVYVAYNTPGGEKGIF